MSSRVKGGVGRRGGGDVGGGVGRGDESVGSVGGRGKGGGEGDGASGETHRVVEGADGLQEEERCIFSLYTPSEALLVAKAVQEDIDSRLESRIHEGAALNFKAIVSRMNLSTGRQWEASEVQRLWRWLAYGIDIGQHPTVVPDSDIEDVRLEPSKSKDGDSGVKELTRMGLEVEALVNTLFEAGMFPPEEGTVSGAAASAAVSSSPSSSSSSSSYSSSSSPSSSSSSSSSPSSSSPFSSPSPSPAARTELLRRLRDGEWEAIQSHMSSSVSPLSMSEIESYLIGPPPQPPRDAFTIFLHQVKPTAPKPTPTTSTHSTRSTSAPFTAASASAASPAQQWRLLRPDVRRHFEALAHEEERVFQERKAEYERCRREVFAALRRRGAAVQWERDMAKATAEEKSS